MGWDDSHGRLSDPTRDEFANWISYRDINRVFPAASMSRPVLEKLYSRLTMGDLSAAGESATWQGPQGRQKRRGCTAIDPTWWSAGGVSGVAAAFEAGDLRASVEDPDDEENVAVHFRNLRFEWDGIFDALPGLREQLRPAAKGSLEASKPVRAPSTPRKREHPDGHDITVEEYLAWIEPSALLAALPDRWSRDTKIRTVADLLEDGLVRTVAGTLVARGHTGRRFELPAQAWKGWACLVDFDFWSAGKRELFSDGEHYDGPAFRAYGVKFDPESAGEHLPLTLGREPATPAPQATNQKRRGPKPKQFWGDAMAAVEASISSGELLASSQADVERALSDWIAEHGSDAGESTIRNYAKPVWERVRRQGQ